MERVGVKRLQQELERMLDIAMNENKCYCCGESVVGTKLFRCFLKYYGVTSYYCCHRCINNPDLMKALFINHDFISERLVDFYTATDRHILMERFKINTNIDDHGKVTYEQII